MPGRNGPTRCVPVRRTTPCRSVALSLAALLLQRWAAADVLPTLPLPSRFSLDLLFQPQLPRGGDGASGRLRTKAEPSSDASHRQARRTWLAAAQTARQTRGPAAAPLYWADPLPRANRQLCVRSRLSTEDAALACVGAGAGVGAPLSGCTYFGMSLQGSWWICFPLLTQGFAQILPPPPPPCLGSVLHREPHPSFHVPGRAPAWSPRAPMARPQSAGSRRAVGPLRRA
eukprot:scaffold354_cov116-Isochrysis_galbana.AAC.12